MIQDIGVEQLKNEYHPKPPKDESRIMIFDAGKLLCRINEEMQIAYPKYGEWRKNKADEGTLIYLFSIGEEIAGATRTERKRDDQSSLLPTKNFHPRVSDDTRPSGIFLTECLLSAYNFPSAFRRSSRSFHAQRPPFAAAGGRKRRRYRRKRTHRAKL